MAMTQHDEKVVNLIRILQEDFGVVPTATKITVVLEANEPVRVEVVYLPDGK